MKLLVITGMSLGLIASSCQNEQKSTVQLSKEELIDRNKQRLGREDQFIDTWLNKSNWNMTTTSTGLRYIIYSDSAGTVVRTDEIARISYRLFLLDSTLVEKYEKPNLLVVRVDHDDVVTGMHEVLKLLSPGDSVRFILPSYLAYGLTGSADIPSNMPLLYDLCLVDKY